MGCESEENILYNLCLVIYPERQRDEYQINNTLKDEQTERQTHRQTDRQTHTQTDRQTDKKKHKEGRIPEKELINNRLKVIEMETGRQSWR